MLRHALAIVLVTTSCSTTAYANGRFPEAQAIESVPGSDGETLYLRTTFGILVSSNHGATWRWICERALGYEGQWDPPIALTRDGRLWVGLEDGLVHTRGGCGLARVPALEGHTLKDLTVAADGDTVWAITGAPGKRGFVWRIDGGAGGAVERRAGFDENLMTIEVARKRVYVSGQPYTTIRGGIFRSDDGGRTFQSDLRGSAAMVAEGPFFIGSVDPADPSRLLVRHLHAKGSDLLLSKDGGKTFTNVLAMKSAMFGFARSADARTIWAGSGIDDHGIFRSTDGGETFARVTYHGVLCLHAASPTSLFLCENAASLGAPAVAVARDGLGAAITPLARFTDVEGPLDCPEARAVCGEGWPATKALLAPRVAPPIDAGVLGPEAPSAPEAQGRRARCTCDVVGQPAPDVRWPIGWGIALPAVAWRRRRSGSTFKRVGR